MHRNVEHVIGGVRGLLVEVITNPGPVREKMLDADLITDQRKIIPEDAAGRRTRITPENPDATASSVTRLTTSAMIKRLI